MRDHRQFVILGCGFTGRRVAARLLRQGLRVLATSRHPESLSGLAAQGCAVIRVDRDDRGTVEVLQSMLAPECRVLYSIPSVPAAPPLWPILAGVAARAVYLSTTGVYGAQHSIDEFTPPAPHTPRELLRVEEEQAAASPRWSSLILRPAAIYGPGRGVHTAMREGRHKLFGAGDNFISRIHADDLAAIAEAALQSELTGAWPVADLDPCPAREIAAFCAELLGLPMPAPGPLPDSEDTRRADRRVDGRAICQKLGIALAYPSYRVGIPAALREESVFEC